MPRSVHTLLQQSTRCLRVIAVCVGSCLLSNRCCAQGRLNDSSVVLTFNASLSAHTPSSPIQLSALLLLLMLFPCLPWYCCCKLSKFSNVSVVLTFNASLSAHAPSSPISLSDLLLLMSLFALILLLQTFQVQCFQCCVGLQCLAQCTCSFFINFIV